MKTKPFAANIVPLFTLLLALTGQAQAAEFFVNKAGDDANDGRSRETAFSSIQRGIDALPAGATLTIGPGEYFESVTRDKLGAPDRDTLIRAEIPGTVLLRGDVPISGFKKVEGRRFVYVVDFDRPVQAVNEGDTLSILETMPNAAELEFIPGSCHYDAGRKKLYISTSDLQSPDRHHYTVSVIGGYGLLLNEPERVIIDGLAATGFNSSDQLPSFPGFRTAWGFMIASGKQCVIRNCTAFLNGGGIGLNSRDAGGNVIEKCTAYGNYSRFCGEGGNIIGFTPHHDTIRDSHAHSSRTQGIRLYGTITGPAIMRNNLSWGNGFGDVWIKGGLAAELGLAENCITLGSFNAYNVRNCIIGTGNSYRRSMETSRDNILLATEKIQLEREVADARNFDFRLHSDSQFRGAGPNGADRGPFPYEKDIFYVKGDGNDQADGLSPANAWRTLRRAVRNLRAGDTVYLESGIYDAGLTLSIGAVEAKTTYLRARGDARVVLRGALQVAQSGGIAFERLGFTDEVAISGSQDIAFRDCRFAGTKNAVSARDTRGLRITHCVFTGFGAAALRMGKSADTYLSGNLFDNPNGPAIQVDRAESILYSDYNSYRNAATAWRIGEAAVSYVDLKKQHDRYSRIQIPEFGTQEGVPELRNPEVFAFGGPLGKSFGVHQVKRTNDLRMKGPFVHSVSATTANIEWWTSRPATCEIAWGDTPACANKMSFDVNCHGSYSLTGLEPGKKYYFKLSSLGSPEVLAEAENAHAVDPNYEVITFTTAREARPPVTYHVAQNGNDDNAGRDWRSAWRTISHAAQAANVGDTVLIAGGVYQESVRVRVTGEANAPITFKGMPGERVVIDGAERALGFGFHIAGKSHLNFDGLYLAQISGSGVNAANWLLWKNGGFRIYQSDHVQITRCMIDGRGLGYSPHFITAWNASNLLLKNCVITAGFNGAMFRNCPDTRVENSVFWRNLIRAAIIDNTAGERFTLSNSIVSDSIPKKVGVQLFQVSTIESFIERNNCYYVRQSDAERKPFLFGDTGRISLADLQARIGPTGSLVGDPQVRRLVGVTAADRDGTPLTYLGDHMLERRPDLDFDDFFSTEPELLRRGIGLQPEAFLDFLPLRPSRAAAR